MQPQFYHSTGAPQDIFKKITPVTLPNPSWTSVFRENYPTSILSFHLQLLKGFISWYKGLIVKLIVYKINALELVPTTKVRRAISVTYIENPKQFYIP